MKTSFKADKFFKDYKISFTTNHHHCSPGWIQIHCPFCSDHNFHLGIELDSGAVNCWRCGGHSLPEVIQTLLKCPWPQVYNILEAYGGKVSPHKQKLESIHPETLCLPAGARGLSKQHLKFLKSRGFSNPEELAKTWGLVGTGPLGDYRFRIIIPFLNQEGKMTSYTSRDITGKASLRYKVCHIDKEVIPLKSCLYGAYMALKDVVVVVEGPMDAWKLGPGAVATCGIQWTPAQASLLTQFKKAVILYDPEPQAYKQAVKLAEYVSWDMDVEVIKWGGEQDPGDLPEEEAKALLRELTT